MKIKPLTLAGVVLILLGLAALIHPDLKMSAKQDEIRARPEKLTIETRRIVTIPVVLSGVLILSGAGLVFFSTRKP